MRYTPWSSTMDRDYRIVEPIFDEIMPITWERQELYPLLTRRIHDNAHNHNWTGQDGRSIHSASPLSDKREPNMTDTPAYTPPEVWVWEKDDSLK